MGDILNINSVVICTNILDVDTVLQGNILNVNSVLVNCDNVTGGTWDCSATTKTDSCSGRTLVSSAYISEPLMSALFSDTSWWWQQQTTSNHSYIDYTAATTSKSCLIKGDPTRYLLGWALDDNGPLDVMYTSAAGAGIIWPSWSGFTTALSNTGIVGPFTLPGANSTIVSGALAALAVPSSYSPVFKDCECTFDCNCVAITGSSGAYTSMTQCLQDDKTCCAECEVNSVIDLAFDPDDCVSACDGTCDYYYTDVVSPLPCPLSLGDHLYTDTSCTPVDRGFYSPKNCDSACKYCYEVGLAGEIINVTLCERGECNVVTLYADADGLPCPTGNNCDDVDCEVCKLHTSFFPYTDATGAPPNLLVGDHIYALSDCVCETWMGGGAIVTPGLYRWIDGVDNWCIEVGSFCEITKKTLCDGIGPDEPVETVEPAEDDGEHGPRKEGEVEWVHDKDTDTYYYDDNDTGYRYHDEDGDGIVDGVEQIGPDKMGPSDSDKK